MPKLQQGDERISDGVNLLISILVRYPEIGTINYDAETGNIRLAFMLRAILADSVYQRLEKTMSGSIAAYHMLENTSAAVSAFEMNSCDRMAMLTIVRDVATLTKGEIALIIALLRDQLKDLLVADENDAMQEEDLLVQEEVIDSMLANVRENRYSSGLIGIREDGRVLVFNK